MKHLIFLFVLLLSSAGHAQDSKIATIPPGEDVIIQLGKGEPAPYRGSLFDVNTSIRWGFWLQQYKLRLKEDVVKEQRACKIKLEYKDKELSITKVHSAAVQKDLQSRVLRTEKRAVAAEDDARNPSFFKTFQWGLIVGLVVSGGTTALIAWGLSKK